MIEFFLSKFWALICAFLLLGVASACINDVTSSAEHAMEVEGLRAFIDDIEGCAAPEGPCRLSLEMANYILQDDDVMVIRNGSAWLEGPGHRYAEPLPTTVVFVDEAGAPLEGHGTITLDQGSTLIIQWAMFNGSCRAVAYEEKEAISLRTASMNILQSSSSL